MIKEALQYIVGLNAPKLNTVGEKTYSDKPLYMIDEKTDELRKRLERVNLMEKIKPYPSEIVFSTLTSFVDFIKAAYKKDERGVCFIENVEYPSLYVHIEDYKNVTLYGGTDEFGIRTDIAKCKCKTPEFKFNEFLEKEQLIIGLQSLFADSSDRDSLLKILGTIKQENVTVNNDDGVTQSVTTSKSIVSGENEKIPNRVLLAPFRTFIEVRQPYGEYIVRLKESTHPYKKEKELVAGLFEADGGVWKLEAIENIKKYLEEALAELDIKVFA